MTKPRTEIVPTDVNHDLTLAADPENVLADARRAAQALQTVIAGKANPVVFNGRQYLEHSDWQCVGTFFGITAKTTETRMIEFGNAKGFEAVAVAVNSAGREIGRQESMSLSDEPNWRGKPLFQLRSMAETRAAVKALKSVLSWVVVLAGYDPHQTIDEFDQAPPPNTAPIDCRAALRRQLLDYARQNKRRAADILQDLTGKTHCGELTQDEAKKAIEAFEDHYLMAERNLD